MASRIDRNLPEEFGGAFLVVSPKGKVVSYAAFDPTPDEAAFWALVDAAIQTAVKEWQAGESGGIKGYAMRGQR